MKTIPIIVYAAFSFLQTAALAEIKVAVLHPLLGDLAKQVGGEHVTVVNLVKPGTELHHFEPTAKDIARLRGSRLILASGKGGEAYLAKLNDSLEAGCRIIDVGKPVPSLKSPTGQPDPHWWHSPDNMKRAARIIADVFAETDPANKSAYKAGAAAAEKRLDALKNWAQQQISLIPKRNRILVSAHDAFAYFCKDFGFRMVPLLGLSAEDDSSPKTITDAIAVIRENHVCAIFPEEQANPKVLAAIARETGVKTGTPLNADGTGPGDGSTFEGMIRHNVEAIVESLKTR